MSTRQDKLQTIKLAGRCVRVGLSRSSGPVFMLESFDHSAGQFTARSVETGTRGKIHLDELHKGIVEGIVHPSKIGGIIYH